MSNKKVLGTAMIITACIFWGISGLFAKALFNISSSITSMWLTQVRMVSAGIILVLLSLIRGEHPFQIFKDLHSAWIIFAYGVFGLVPVQYAYLSLIHI